jgi:NAD(P)-dependent dehydrogenase (short-subunit alcohol dehydrogenase family)
MWRRLADQHELGERHRGRAVPLYATIDSFQPIGRPGEPREIANVALFLASDESSFVTGTPLVDAGAMTAQWVRFRPAGPMPRSSP